ncbi:hypothetical protein IEQ34_007887 [Dendrobium chrysotoxum]|uniref:Uncharacterized protein n=1 Tax=Dendrobium chrysotoxum TaxID=161865 RepID=A0AAV7GN85_DENCH|nr:hypothetical protein IEQ34_007887 [Dendrobium chrysotoxum]
MFKLHPQLRMPDATPAQPLVGSVPTPIVEFGVVPVTDPESDNVPTLDRCNVNVGVVGNLDNEIAGITGHSVPVPLVSGDPLVIPIIGSMLMSNVNTVGLDLIDHVVINSAIHCTSPLVNLACPVQVEGECIINEVANQIALIPTDEYLPAPTLVAVEKDFCHVNTVVLNESSSATNNGSTLPSSEPTLSSNVVQLNDPMHFIDVPISLISNDDLLSLYFVGLMYVCDGVCGGLEQATLW